MLFKIIGGIVGFLLMFTLIMNLKFPTTQGLFMWGLSFVACLIVFVVFYLCRSK